MIRKLFCYKRSSGGAAGRPAAIGMLPLFSRVLLFSVAWGVGAGGTLRAASSAASAPNWLVAAKQADTGHLGDGSAAVIVWESVDFTVDATGKFVKTERRAIHVLNFQAAAKFLNAEGKENSDVTVTSIRGWAITKRRAGDRIAQEQRGDADDVFSICSLLR
jgi:hypothetical protein